MPRGAIVLVPFPFTDLTGHKVRPALVLYSQNGGEDCIVAFISSNQQRKMGMYDVAVTPTKLNGIKLPSIIKVNKIATLQKKIVLGEIGDLEPDTLLKVGSVLKKLLGI